ncbi:MAG: DegT/DnrJ/EryC1/StrS aminotransferase family protein [Alphaproteobacteria bacterium]|nr:DegT/DnrJ/EryC1/StrS aminotransferase family protein [Alphaproteobacteria bacterium]
MARNLIPFVDLVSQKNRLKAGVMQAMERVLDHGLYIMGPEIADLESILAQSSGAKYAISCSSGTDAIMLALLAKDIKRADAVFVPAFSYFATAEAVALLGANPIFVDVCPRTFNMDPISLQEAITKIKRTDLKPAGVIAVDLFGQPADYKALSQVAEENNLWLIADSSQSFGSGYQGKSIGQFAEISCTSFSPAKPLGGYGEGGAIFLNDDDLYAKVMSCRNHGQNQEDGVRLGFNGHMSSIQAAILLEKLTVFEEEMQARQACAERYQKAFAGKLEIPFIAQDCQSSWSQYTLLLDNRDVVSQDLQEQGIPHRIYYHKPLNEQLAYRRFPVAPNGTPVAKKIAERVLSLPIHAYLKPETQDWIVAGVLEACARNS